MIGELHHRPATYAPEALSLADVAPVLAKVADDCVEVLEAGLWRRSSAYILQEIGERLERARPVVAHAVVRANPVEVPFELRQALAFLRAAEGRSVEMAAAMNGIVPPSPEELVQLAADVDEWSLAASRLGSWAFERALERAEA